MLKRSPLTLLAFATLLTLPTGLPGQEAPPPPPAAEGGTGAATPRFIALIREAQALHGLQKNFDALQRIEEAEVLDPSSPLIPNVRGSIYTAMRDFDKAREQFQKARALSPDAFEPKFNLVELDYVSGNYAAAERGFQQLLQDYPKLQLEVRHLTQFKVLVSQLKQDKVTEARQVMTNFSFMDDTPAYYYSKAAFAFQEGKRPEGQEWLARAASIYKAHVIVPYVDSLMEAKWIESLSVTPAKPAE